MDFTFSSECQNILKRVRLEIAIVCNLHTENITFIEKKELFYYKEIQGAQLSWTELCSPNPHVEALIHDVTGFRDKAFKDN